MTLKLNPGDEQRIASTAATLTGIASSVDLATGSVTATEVKTMSPAFTIETDGGEKRTATLGGETRAAGNPVLTAILRLPGVIPGEKQELTLVVTLTNGTVQTIVTDLTEALKNFGSGKMEPLALDAALTLPIETEISATISDWNVVNNGGITVN